MFEGVTERISRSAKSWRRGTGNGGGAPRVPGGLPVVGHAVQFGRDPVGFLRECRRKYGDVFILAMPGGERTFFLNPLDYSAYLRNKSLRFRELGAEMGARAFGYTLAEVEQAGIDESAHQIGTFMKGEHLQRLNERMQRKLEEHLCTVPPGWQEDSLYRWISEHVFRAGADAIFGDGFYSDDLRRAFESVDSRFPYLVAGIHQWLLPGTGRAHDAFGSHFTGAHPAMSRLMTERRALFTRKGMAKEASGKFDASLLWAAQANTLPTAFWTMLFVSRDPAARRAIVAELEDIVERDPASGTRQPFTRQQLARMVYLGSAIQEVLRLMAAPMVARRAVEATSVELDDGRVIEIAAGEDLSLFPRVTHLDADVFEDPYQFHYDRFVGDGHGPVRFYKGGRELRFAMLPFGAGESMCPGRFFAIDEFKIVVATMLVQFEMEICETVVPGVDLSRTGLGTYTPTSDIRFRYRRRPD